MHCPTCCNPLRCVEYEGVEIYTCDGCGGELITPEAMATIVNRRENTFNAELVELLRDREPMHGIAADEPARKFVCPDCDGPMKLVNYGGDSGIFIDRCDDCGGLWLDHDELEKIQIIMQSWQDDAPERLREVAGSLERARQIAAESTNRGFAGSRFSFVNAVINRFLDAA